ncbi:unnamed protein product [marine sediment metagenome]|uniref:Uncharacterized protein n=1 Tax=marine sediment metagenome TaxID=412755 RepID=X1ADW2_9ZZZZ
MKELRLGIGLPVINQDIQWFTGEDYHRLNIKLTTLIVAYGLLEQLKVETETREMIQEAIDILYENRKYDITTEFSTTLEINLKRYMKKKETELKEAEDKRKYETASYSFAIRSRSVSLYKEGETTNLSETPTSSINSNMLFSRTPEQTHHLPSSNKDDEDLIKTVFSRRAVDCKA